MRALATRVDVAGLHARRHLNALLEKAAQDTIDGAGHGNAGHGCGNLAGAHDVANLEDWFKDAVCGGAQHTVRRMTGNDAGDTGVGSGRAIPDDLAEEMPSISLDDRIAILARIKARANANDIRSHGPFRTEVLLGEDGIDDNLRLQFRNALTLGVDEDRDVTTDDDRTSLRAGAGKTSANALDLT